MAARVKFGLDYSNLDAWSRASSFEVRCSVEEGGTGFAALAGQLGVSIEVLFDASRLRELSDSVVGRFWETAEGSAERT